MASGSDREGNNLYLDLIRNALFETNGPLYYFYNMMFGHPYDAPVDGMGANMSFHPAINGYTLVFMAPPHLSGYINNGYKVACNDLLNQTKMICFLAVDFTPPAIQVSASELPSRSGSLPFAMEVSGTGQLSISYLDDQYEHNFAFHKTWLSYIEDVTRGVLSSDNNTKVIPDACYFTPDDPKFGQIDYMTSAYVIKFKPVFGSTVPGDIIYVGKATGIFPLNSPDKEIIGRRDSNELVTTTYNYPCANYRNWVAGTTHRDLDEYICNEIISNCSEWYSAFGQSSNFNLLCGI